jgi:uncharacterized protein YggE
MVRILGAMLVLAVAGLLGPAQAAPEAGVVAVQGSGIVEVVPDIADITIGVDNEDATAAAAIDANAAAMARVVADAKRAGIGERDIQTSVLQLSPYAKDDRGKELIRYRAVNTVRIRVRDLSRMGAVMRDLVGSGTNRIQGIRFSIANPTPHLDQARRQAVADAKRRAELLAEAAGARLGPIVELTESTWGDSGVVTEARAMRQAVPVEPGQLALQATVQIKWHLAP